MKGIYSALLALSLGLSACQTPQTYYDDVPPLLRAKMDVSYDRASKLVGHSAWFSSEECPYIKLYSNQPLNWKQREETATFSTGRFYEKIRFEDAYIVTEPSRPWVLYKVLMVNTKSEAYLTTLAEPSSVYTLTDRKRTPTDCFLTVEPESSFERQSLTQSSTPTPALNDQDDEIARLSNQVNELNKKTESQQARINELMMAKEYDSKLKTYTPVTSSTVKSPASKPSPTTRQSYNLNRYTPPKKLIPDVQYNYGGACPCSGYSNCIGPRGGRYCITSGGNKRYR
jgi:hypothetical protein